MIELVSELDVNKLSFRKKGVKNILYRRSLKEHITWLKSELNKLDREEADIGINIELEDVKRVLIDHIKDNEYHSIARGLREYLSEHRIEVGIVTFTSGKKGYRFRKMMDAYGSRNWRWYNGNTFEQ